MKTNLHKGSRWDYHHLGQNYNDLAATVQSVLEDKIVEIMAIARQYSNYLCYGGGVALNCVANSKIRPMFKEMWIFPSPGDSGSALGAAAAINDKMLDWQGPYLGYNINREINPKEVAQYLVENSVCGVANGRAEFGPRALGNRSLLADCRLPIKDTVNTIKKRQKFRPFAPAILAEFADQYFDGPMNEYMQFVAKAKHDYRSVTHVDGTSRVQLVHSNCKSVLRPILEEWYELTGCPMLLNTSLNIKGQPLVNNWNDAEAFASVNKVKVF
jgi:carbamoyltransferase